MVLGGLSACGDTGVSAPSFGESASAQSPAAGASGGGVVPMAHLSPCPMIPDTVNIHTQADLDAFDSLDCFTVERHLFVQNTSDIVDLSPLHGLRSVGGYIGIADNTDLKYVKLPNLEKTGEGLVLEGNHALRKISAPALRYVKGNLHIFNNQSLKSVSFDWLISVGEDMIFAGNNALMSLELPKLTTIMGQFIFEHSERFKYLCLPNLVAVNGDFTVHFNPGLKSIIAPVLTTIWGDLTIERNARLQLLELDCLQWVTGDVVIIYNHMLPECSVDSTVAGIAHIGGDVITSDNYAVCPDVRPTARELGCTKCETNICVGDRCDDRWDRKCRDKCDGKKCDDYQKPPCKRGDCESDENGDYPVPA
ncbi:hypothetical protein DN745_12060 [Bradymonas sediminis]|uniref:Receptor L-domain domain-containing protein n=1 Tax=Bradymonas sediminis TaxID=1548548 RepID=A0A2Z4FMX0_9DELT|nr:hypothetical protein DN745_12060 [Bradymonas sediminis]